MSTSTRRFPAKANATRRITASRSSRALIRASERDLLDDLQRVARKLRTATLSAAQYDYHGRFRSRRIIVRFASWGRAVSAAGLETSRDLRITHDRLMWNLGEVWRALGREPAREDMIRPRSRWSAYAYLSRYGGWPRTIQIFRRWKARQRNSRTPMVRPGSAADRRAMAVEHGRIDAKRRRLAFLRYCAPGVRFKVLERDAFRCVACGRSPATHKGLALHVDHIKPASRGGGLGGPNYKNLQTLCRDCNYGKKDRLPKKQMKNRAKRAGTSSCRSKRTAARSRRRMDDTRGRGAGRGRKKTDSAAQAPSESACGGAKEYTREASRDSLT